mmetsp:Transcript_42872/g.85977  ORF Transcript_42872/g.85977 Transcript_42872/m.85977 type:complete len:81 (-) Transcript_42872:718-960(-)
MQAIARLTERLDAALRVTLSDGRVLVGRFACFDKQRNVLLIEAREFRAGASQGSRHPERNLGIVLIPRRWITACHAIENA